jgi:hypothetical protein
VETAAPGEPLSGLLGRSPKAALSAVEKIASWIVQLGVKTDGSSALDGERQRLRDEIVPRWLDQGATTTLVDSLPELHGVLQHNDLGSWNIVVQRGGGFVAVDWESACASGLPLWDLLYFLVDCLPLLEGARTAAERVNGAVRMLRGESAMSPMFFRWLSRGAEAAQVPDEAVGAIATLCWLHHGLSHVSRREAAELAEPGGAAELFPIDLLAPMWLSDPALGPAWKARRA